MAFSLSPKASGGYSSVVPPAAPARHRSGRFIEGGHQLEKLEFALAVAITRGDRHRVDQLRSQILDLGGNREEPGT